MTGFLYIGVVLIWGSTWLAVALQKGPVPSVVSVFYRFALSAAILWGILVGLGKLKPISRKDHFFCLLQGCCIFSLNFYCFYHGVYYITSGLIAVVFSMAVLFNAMNGFVFFGQRPSRRLIPACFLGMGGLALLFWRDLFLAQHSSGLLTGVALSVLGTYFFSLGNMIGFRHRRHGLDVFSTNAYAMGYGAGVTGLIGLWQGVSFMPEFSWQYMGALGYLAILGSVVAFAAYFTLIGRIGPDKTAYSTLLSTGVALMLSTFFEGYQWQWTGAVGLAMIMAGNLVMFSHGEVVDKTKRIFRVSRAK